MRAEGKRAWTIRGSQPVVLGWRFEHARRRLGHGGEDPVRQSNAPSDRRPIWRDRRIVDHEELAELKTRRSRRPIELTTALVAELRERRLREGDEASSSRLAAGARSIPDVDAGKAFRFRGFRQ